MSIKSHIRLKYEPITVKEPYKAEVKTFSDPDDFTKYYREHEDNFKGLSTLRLNKTYKVPGYRISVRNRGKENEELILKKDYYGSSNETTSDEAITEAITLLEQRIENVEHYLQQLR